MLILTPNRKLHVVLLLSFTFLLFGSLYGEIFAQTVSSTQHEIRVQDTTYSQFIPLYGTFSVQMEYVIPIELHNAELVHAGDSFDMLVTINKPGKLVTVFLHDENILGTFEDELKIGEEKTIEIPESWVGQVFASPQITIQPTVTGPATITPESTLFDSETTKQFQIFVNEDIKAFDTLQIDLDVRIKMKNGGSITLGVVEIPLGEHISDIQANPTSIHVQLKKIIPTNLHLQIKEGEIPEHIKVRTVLTDDLQTPIKIKTNSIEIYVDGIPHSKIIPSTWSENIFVGDGTHNFQARFSETRDPNNVAITYTDAESAIQTITLVSSNVSNLIQFQCESNMIIKDGKCVEEEKGFFGGGCLIATAVYGTELAPQVQLLREIRDNTVLSTNTGMKFMTGFNQIYYSFSPYIADIQRENYIVREATKIAVYPMLTTLHLMELADKGSEYDVIILGTGVILANLGMYIVTPIIGIYHIRKLIYK